MTDIMISGKGNLMIRKERRRYQYCRVDIYRLSKVQKRQISSESAATSHGNSLASPLPEDA